MLPSGGCVPATATSVVPGTGIVDGYRLTF